MPTSVPSASIDRHAGDPVPGAQRVDLAQGVVGRAGDRVGDHAGLGPLHQVDLGGLVLDRAGCGAARRCRPGGPSRSPSGPRSPCPSRWTPAGCCSLTLRDSRVVVSTPLGTTSDSPGSSSTSSKVRPSVANFAGRPGADSSLVMARDVPSFTLRSTDRRMRLEWCRRSRRQRLRRATRRRLQGFLMIETQVSGRWRVLAGVRQHPRGVRRGHTAPTAPRGGHSRYRAGRAARSAAPRPVRGRPGRPEHGAR